MRRYFLTLLLVLSLVSPQLVAARNVYGLNDGWRFFFKHENSSDMGRSVSIPHTWNTDAVGREGSYLQTTANYVNNCYVPKEWEGKRLFLKFAGVNNVATLFVNGRFCGEHRGGATAFTFEVTNYVRFGADNLVTVIVSNNNDSGIMPVSSKSNLYGGIYRDVELIVTDQVAISPLYYGSDGVLIHQKNVTAQSAEALAEVHISAIGEHKEIAVDIAVRDEDGQTVFENSVKSRHNTPVVEVPIELSNPNLWSPQSPNLYTVDVVVTSGDSRDSISVKTGFRSVEVTPQGGLMINGQRQKINGVTLHHDNALSAGALTLEDYSVDFAMIQDLGANAIRSNEMPHAQRLYDMCDQQGILSWIDLPFSKAPFLGDVGYFPTDRFRENGKQQLHEIIAQNINHPSVVMWGIFSMLSDKGEDPKAYIRGLNELAHKLDPSRPTVAASDQDGDINFITDLVVWRQSVGWNSGLFTEIDLWRNILREDWNHLRSGVTYGEPGFISQQNSELRNPPKSNWMPENRQREMHEVYSKSLDADSLFWGVWLGAMFDNGAARLPYGVDGSGLVTMDRRQKKDAYYLYRALWNEKSPTLHIVDSRQHTRLGTDQSVKIYASERPTLLINGDTVAVTAIAPAQYISERVSVEGDVKIEARLDSLYQRVNIRVGNAPKSRERLVPLRR